MQHEIERQWHRYFETPLVERTTQQVYDIYVVGSEDTIKTFILSFVWHDRCATEQAVLKKVKLGLEGPEDLVQSSAFKPGFFTQDQQHTSIPSTHAELTAPKAAETCAAKNKQK